MSDTIRVLVCDVGAPPRVAELSADEGGQYRQMRDIVGGYIERVVLDDGVVLWCNEEGRLLDLPLNRVIPAAPRPAPDPEVWGDAAIIYAEDPDEPLARPGEPGEWRIHGNFFLARDGEECDLASLTDADVARYTAMFAGEVTP